MLSPSTDQFGPRIDDSETGDVLRPKWEHVALAAVEQHGAVQKPHELAEFLRELACIAPKVVVEIGSYAGGTLYAWRQVAETVICVDLPGTGTYAATGDAKNTHGATAVWGDSHNPLTLEAVKGVLAGRPVDCLFIDGDHSYDGVKADYEMYAPLVREGGLVAFHDIIDHPEQPAIEVSRFWREIRTANSVEIISGAPWGGIGIVNASGN